tara:strand:+ start:776 stop:1588 length:813 start_codon:yes stop_codon:yes gene_type:complete
MKKNDGVWIPIDAFSLKYKNEKGKIKRLEVNQTLMLYKIYMLDGDKGCFATNKYFADFFQISKRQVSTTISALVKKGFISLDYEYEDGTKSIKYRILRTRGRSVQYPHGIVTNTPTLNSSTINKEVNKDINKKHLCVFDEWYALYDKKTTKKQAIVQWLKISPDTHPTILSHTKRFIKSVKKRFRPDPVRYLRNEVYNDEIIEKEKSKEEIELERIERNERNRKLKQQKEKERLEKIDKELKEESFSVKDELLKDNPRYQRHLKLKKKVA